MDILIPNLELPLEERIQLSIYPNGLVVNHSTLDVNNRRKAVALPDHGRLIDADALCNELKSPDFAYFSVARFESLITEAETIVEATE